MDLNKTINEVVVVEGYHDLAKLKSIFPDIDIIITNGSEISTETLQELKQLNESRGLILLLDPDFPGEKIRKTINEYVGDTLHAYIQKHKCISKNNKKVGIEHASKEDIIEALNNVLTPVKTTQEFITTQDMFVLKLSGCKDAKNNREKICIKTGITLCNAKTLRNKLNMFGVSKKEVIEKLRT